MTFSGNVRAVLGALFGANRHGREDGAAKESAQIEELRALDLQNPDFISNPYPYLAQLQDRDPVHRSINGAWVLTRYDDVHAALADRRLGNAPSPYAVVNERNRTRFTCADVANNIIPFLDRPEHTRPRKIIARAFATVLKASGPDLQGMAHSALLALDRSGDALHDLATPYSLGAISSILGIPSEDAPRLKRWSQSFFYLFSIIPSQEIRQQLDHDLDCFRTYLAQLVRERRHRPRADLISALLDSAIDGEGLSDAELVDHCMLLFSDGVENVDSGIASALYALLTNPEQMTLLQSRPDLVSAAVEECLRFEAPGQFIGRVVQEDLELHGIRLQKHSPVLLMIGAANRDPRRFESPHRFDITRSPNDHLSFGRGAHACIGAQLVKAEMEAVLHALLQSGMTLALADPNVHWEARLGHRWLAGLPVTVSGSTLQ